MWIDLQAAKERRTCKHCKYLHGGRECLNPKYSAFIYKACKLGFCDGFENLPYIETETEENTNG